MKKMKLNVQFDKEIRFNVPSRQVIQSWTQLLSGTRLSMRSLALAEEPKPSKRRKD
jgi:hypothetical protein